MEIVSVQIRTLGSVGIGLIWNIGKGKVFYFRPGHETFPVYKQKVALQIVENAVRYLASELPD